MSKEPKIVEQEVRNKEGKVVGHVTYDGKRAKTTGEVRAQHIEGAEIAWAEKYKMSLELIEDTGAKCVKCGGAQALYRHRFDNDKMQRTEFYNVIRCELCGSSVAVHGSGTNVPYQ